MLRVVIIVEGCTPDTFFLTAVVGVQGCESHKSRLKYSVLISTVRQQRREAHTAAAGSLGSTFQKEKGRPRV
jgi:hypothetical protein